jgi:DNA-binding response OmpR family regulator
MGVDRREVLLVVPEPDTAALLEQGLEFVGLAVRRVASGAEALAVVSEHVELDLIVMDLAQPDLDGLVLVGDLRDRTRVPIIVCGEGEGGSVRPHGGDAQGGTAAQTGQRNEALLVFRLGADDYVAKPFDVEDVVARAEAALRRVGEASSGNLPSPQPSPRVRGSEGEASGHDTGTTVVGDLALDAGHHRVMVGGEEVRLSRSEYLLL